MSRELVLIVHDDLGSRLDFAHLAIALASEGFVVAATDSENSILLPTLSKHDDENELLQRRVRDTEFAVREIRNRFEVKRKVGLVGHGQGAKVVTHMESRFKGAFARIAIAGLYIDSNTNGPLDCVLQDPFLPVLGELDGITPEWTVVPHLGKRSPLMIPKACRMSFRCHAMCRFLKETLMPLLEFVPSGISEDCTVDISNYRKGGNASEIAEFLMPYVYRFFLANLREEDDHHHNE
jgi:hypothetical protein